MTLPRSLVCAVQLARALLAAGALAATLCWPLTGDPAWAAIAGVLAAGNLRLGRDLRQLRGQRRTPRRAPSAPRRAEPAVLYRAVPRRPTLRRAGTKPPAGVTKGSSGPARAVAVRPAVIAAAGCGGELCFEDAFGRLLALVGVRVRLRVSRPGLGPLGPDFEGLLAVGRQQRHAGRDRFQFELAGSSAGFWIAREELNWAAAGSGRLVLAVADTLVELRPAGVGEAR